MVPVYAAYYQSGTAEPRSRNDAIRRPTNQDCARHQIASTAYIEGKETRHYEDPIPRP